MSHQRFFNAISWKRAGAALVTVVLLGGALAPAQEPTIPPREVARPVPAPTVSVFEADIAAGETHAVAVSNSVDGGYGQIGYGVYEYATGQWIEHGLVPFDLGPPEMTFTGDPTIAYDAVNDDFVLAALVRPAGLAVVRYSPQPGPGVWGDWQSLEVFGGIHVPRIVAGEVTGEGQEFYIVGVAVSSGSAILYRHTTNGGQTSADWTGGLIPDPDDPNEFLDTIFTPIPTVVAGGPLYIVFPDSSDWQNGGTATFRFLKGVDQPGGTVEFDYLRNSVGLPGQPLEVTLNRGGVHIPNTGELWIPTPSFLNSAPYANSTFAKLRADPTNADRLYLAYHDTQNGGDDDDFNIYLRTLTHIDATNWIVAPRVLVNDDSTQFESDQFDATMEVDDQARQVESFPGDWFEIRRFRAALGRSQP